MDEGCEVEGEMYGRTTTVGLKAISFITTWSLSPFSMTSLGGTTSIDLMNPCDHSEILEKSRNWELLLAYMCQVERDGGGFSPLS